MATFIEALLPSVHDTLTLREALSKIGQCDRAFKTQGVLSMLDNFTIIYSCYGHLKDLKQETIDEILNALLRGIALLESELKKILNERLSENLRIKYLNTVKMFVYLMIEMTNFVEKKHMGSKENDLMPLSSSNKAKPKKPAAKKPASANLDVSISESSAAFDWNDTKEKILESLSKLLQLNIQKLWDPPIVEEQFVIFVTNLCYKLMENLQNNSIRPQQKKAIKEHLCHILGLMIKKYNHSYGACVMIIQTLPHYEHFSSVYADLIQTCVVQLGYEAILPDLLREFHHANLSSGPGGSAAANTAGKDNPNLKFYSQFLIDLADRIAPNLLPYLSLIQDFLDEESYLMRNSILYIYGEIIIKVLNQEATSNDLKLKQMRNELLDTLIEHVHDTNALTRSRTLQIWRRICEENAMPLSYMNELMKRCVGRMQDVASSVRKSAFQLLCDLIRKNPYGIKSIEMSMGEVETNFAKEEAVLSKLTEENDELIEEINKLVEKKDTKENEEEKEGEEDEPMETNHQEKNAENFQSDTNKEFELQQKKEKHQQLVILQTSKVNYLKDMMAFVKQIQEAIPVLSRLLFSKTQTDVLEVIGFFVTCYEHGLTDMLFGIRKMLSLVIYSEKNIKDAVVNAYKRLYLNSNSPVQIAKQLIKLIQDLTVCERDALEELIGEFATSGELSNSVIKVLWEIFASNEHQAQNRLYALILLSMIIKKIPEKGRANIQVLIDYGLSISSNSEEKNEQEVEDNENKQNHEATDLEMLIYSETCLALSYVTPEANVKRLTQQEAPPNDENSNPNNKKDKKNQKGKQLNDTTQNEESSQRRLQFNNEPFKLPLTHQIFERLTEIINTQFTNLKTIYWIPFLENAMTCIFKLADNPIVIAESLVNKLIEKIPPFKYLQKQTNTKVNSQLPPVPLFNEDAASQTANPSQAEPNHQNTQVNDENFTVNSQHLARFYGLIGILATKLLIFLNQSVVCELKRRKLCKENQSTFGLSSNRSNKLTPLSKSKSRRMSMKLIKSFNPQSDLALEEEMGLQGAEAEDVEVIFVETVIEQKVAVSSPQYGFNSLLAQFLPSIIKILREPFKYTDDQLQLSCALALVKLMVLSPRICTENLQLLFTLMEKSANSDVKSQLIIGVGDLVYRFPNALEPWTSHLYSPLRDTKSTNVRMNTIRVLSHLILKEMIKTRGQIYEIALCTIDPDPQICALSKLFFQELSQRNNGLVIYNAMPDIISQLSGGGSNGSKDNTPDSAGQARKISEESFRTVVTYLFSFIKRDKQCETLIEKLCHAFRQANTSERKCRDLVFCLSKIQLSENGIKKLKETFKWYADKLCIPAVYDTFKQVILKNARKLPMLKNETKLLIDELEKQIEEIKQKGIGDDVAIPNTDNEEMQEDKETANEEDDGEEAANQHENQPEKKSVLRQKAKVVAKQPAASAKQASKPVIKKGGKSTAAPSRTSSRTKTAASSKKRVKVVTTSDESDDSSDKDDDDDDENDDEDEISDSE